MKQKILQFTAIVLFAMAGFTASSQNWLIAGNNTTTSTNFIGTRNAQPLIFKTNNVERMRLSKNGQLGIGLINPTASLQITNTTNSQGGLIVTNSFGTPVNVVGIASSSVTGDGFGYDLFA